MIFIMNCIILYICTYYFHFSFVTLIRPPSCNIFSYHYHIFYHLWFLCFELTFFRNFSIINSNSCYPIIEMTTQHQHTYTISWNRLLTASVGSKSKRSGRSNEVNPSPVPPFLSVLHRLLFDLSSLRISFITCSHIGFFWRNIQLGWGQGRLLSEQRNIYAGVSSYCQSLTFLLYRLCFSFWIILTVNVFT